MAEIEVDKNGIPLKQYPKLVKRGDTGAKVRFVSEAEEKAFFDENPDAKPNETKAKGWGGKKKA